MHGICMNGVYTMSRMSYEVPYVAFSFIALKQGISMSLEACSFGSWLASELPGSISQAEVRAMYQALRIPL